MPLPVLIQLCLLCQDQEAGQGGAPEPLHHRPGTRQATTGGPAPQPRPCGPPSGPLDPGRTLRPPPRHRAPPSAQNPEAEAGDRTTSPAGLARRGGSVDQPGNPVSGGELAGELPVCLTFLQPLLGVHPGGIRFSDAGSPAGRLAGDTENAQTQKADPEDTDLGRTSSHRH